MDRHPRAKLEVARIVDGDGGARFAEAVLVFEGKAEPGRAECKAEGAAGELIAMAEATIAAARALAGQRFSCIVRLAEVTDLCGTEFALVNASLYAGGRAVPVLGSCAIRDDAVVSIARATLDAVNRWLDLSLHGYSLAGFEDLESFERPGGESARSGGV